MLKKLLMLCVALALSLSAGFAAAVEVNSADRAALESVKGIGPAHAKAIIEERSKTVRSRTPTISPRASRASAANRWSISKGPV